MKSIGWNAFLFLAGVTAGFAQVIEVEANYTVLSDVGTVGSVGTNTFANASANVAVRLLDIGDNVRIPFSVQTTGFHDLYVRARSGSQGNSASYSAGYKFRIDGGNPYPYILSSTPPVWDATLGNLAWGYFKLTNVQLNAGTHTFTLEAAFTHCYVDALIVSAPGSTGPTPLPTPTPSVTPTPTPGPTPTPLPPQVTVYEAETTWSLAQEVGSTPVAVVGWGSASPAGSIANNAVQLIDAGDAISITLNAPTTKTYNVRVRVRRGSNGSPSSYNAGYRFRVDNIERSHFADASATVWDAAYNNIGWGYINLNPMTLGAGSHLLTIQSVYPYGYVDVVRVESDGVGPTPTPTPTPTPVPFPNGITGMRLWLRADDAAAGAGGAVTTWNDQSVRGHHAIALAPAQAPSRVSSALNGHAVIRFPGSATSAYQLPNIFNAAPAVTRGDLFVVSRMDFTNGNGTPRENGLWKFSATVGASTRNSGAFFRESFGRNSVMEFATLPSTLGTYHLYNVTGQRVGIGGGLIAPRVNGLARGSQSGGVAEWSYAPTLGLGATSFRGDIAEVIAIGPEPDPEVREGISKYLVQKYALLDYPETPSGFTLINNPSGTVTLRWTPSTRDELTTYIVEEYAGSGFVERGRIDNTGEIGVGVPPAGTTRYRLRAENLRGVSAPTHEVSVTK